MPTSAIVVFIAGSFITLYQGILELRKEKKNWWKISIFLGLFCVLLGAGIYDILLKDDTEKANKKEVIDTTKTEAENTRSKIDSSGKIILEKIDSGNIITFFKPIPNKKEAAILIGCPDGYPNPVLKQLADSFIIKLCIANIGKGIAYNILDASASVGMINNEISYHSVLRTPLFNNRVIMPPNGTNTMSASMVKKNDDFTNQRHFFCVKLTYSDSLSKRKEWIGVFETTNLPVGVTLEIPNSEIFYRIENYLKSKNVW